MIIKKFQIVKQRIRAFCECGHELVCVHTSTSGVNLYHCGDSDCNKTKEQSREDYPHTETVEIEIKD